MSINIQLLVWTLKLLRLSILGLTNFNFHPKNGYVTMEKENEVYEVAI